MVGQREQLPHIGLPDWKVAAASHRQGRRSSSSNKSRQQQQPTATTTSPEGREPKQYIGGDNNSRRRRVGVSSGSREGGYNSRNQKRKPNEPPAAQQRPPSRLAGQQLQQQQQQQLRPPSRISQQQQQQQQQRHPEHEIAFFGRESPANNNNNDLKGIAPVENDGVEPGLFSFPWKWNLNNNTHQQQQHRESDDNEDRERAGVPSVIFAIKSDDDDEGTHSSPTNTFFSEDSPPRKKAATKHSKQQRQRQHVAPPTPPLPRQRQPLHNPIKHRPKMARSTPSPMDVTGDLYGSHPRYQRQQQSHYRHHQQRLQRLPDPPDLPDSMRPITPTPQIPKMIPTIKEKNGGSGAGNQEDPIPCSESLAGSLLHRYARGATNRRQQKLQQQRKHNNNQKKQSISDLTALESVSTYDLEQRYKAREVHRILTNPRGRDSIALPKLTPPPPPIPVTTQQFLTRPPPAEAIMRPKTTTTTTTTTATATAKMGANYTNPVAAMSPPDYATTKKAGPPGRIGNHIVYNLSEHQDDDDDYNNDNKNPNKNRQIKHNVSISESLEKMKSNLRQKQSLLTKSVTDLQAKQKLKQQQQQSNNHSHMNDRKPETAPLLNNQGYISDIFTDIASKMNKNDNKKEPYIPKARAILNAKKKNETLEKASNFHSLLNTMQKGRKGGSSCDKNVRNSKNAHDINYDPPSVTTPIDLVEILGSDDADLPHQHAPRSERSPQVRTPVRPPSSQSKRAPVPGQRPTSKSSKQNPNTSLPRNPYLRLPDDLDLHSNDMCNIAGPLTDQIGGLISSSGRPSSSLYLPNIHTHRGTPISNTKLPFRPSSTTVSKGMSKSQFPSVQDVIDVSSLSLKNVIDVTSQTSKTSLLAKQLQNGKNWMFSQASRDTESMIRHKDVIDVASLSSSQISETTVKKVICVDEDSKGIIRAKHKLSAMSKNSGKHNHQKSRKLVPGHKNKIEWGEFDWNSPKEEEEVDMQDVYGICEIPENEEQIPLSEQGFHDEYAEMDKSQRSQVYQTIYELADKNKLQAHDDVEETEIVFAPSKDANKSLFDGIWDIEIPNFFSTDKSSVDPSKTTGDRPAIRRAVSPPISTLEVNVPTTNKSKGLNCTSGLNCLNPSGLQGQNTKRGLAPPTGRNSPGLPWAIRALKNKSRDAPINTSTPREPEGTVSGLPVNRQKGKPLREPEILQKQNNDADKEEDEDGSTEEDPTEDITEVYPPPAKSTPQKSTRKASAFAKKAMSSERSTETRSVTFRDIDQVIGSPTKYSHHRHHNDDDDDGDNDKKEVPDVICTDQKSEGTDLLSRMTKSVRRLEHPWDKDSQCSSRKAFHDLSTKSMESNDILKRARRHESRNSSNNITNGISSNLRSMYDEILEATAPQHIIILDDDHNNLHDGGYDGRLTGQEWANEGGDSSILRTNQQRSSISVNSKARSTSSSSRRRHHRELQRRDNGAFFDFLCY